MKIPRDIHSLGAACVVGLALLAAAPAITAAEGWTGSVHTPTFRPDESAIVTGVTAAASLLEDFSAADPLD